MRRETRKLDPIPRRSRVQSSRPSISTAPLISLTRNDSMYEHSSMPASHSPTSLIVHLCAPMSDADTSPVVLLISSRLRSTRVQHLRRRAAELTLTPAVGWGNATGAATRAGTPIGPVTPATGPVQEAGACQSIKFGFRTYVRTYVISMHLYDSV